MNATFYSPDPHSGSRRRLEALLHSGTDQVAICCAYCTAAGVEFLKPHAARLRNTDSFVVVSWDKPTDFAALEELHTLIPGHLYVHNGNATPYEHKVGYSKMHSKVFYARANESCELWTGSHNLTASAILGANCEAAVLLEGSAADAPFQDALRHLEACRDEAQLFYPGMTGPDDLVPNREPTIIIHAEGSASSPPWHLYLRAKGTQIDNDLTLPAGLRLYLHAPGSLSGGWQSSRPHSAYSGSLTGVNLTPDHPSYSGAEANWPAAQYAVDLDFTGASSVFGPNSSNPRGVTTQALFSIDDTADLNEIWIRKKPRSKLQRVLGPEVRRSADQDMLRFFTSKSRGAGAELVFQPVQSHEPVYELSGEDIREEDVYRLSEKLQTAIQRKEKTRMLSKEMEESAPFVYRANYRL